VGSHGSSSLLSLAEGDGLTLVSDSHKLLSLLCHLKCCHGDLLAISYIYIYIFHVLGEVQSFPFVILDDIVSSVWLRIHIHLVPNDSCTGVSPIP
jgi:hypothetical protein